MGFNMSYVMFENTVRAMEEMKERMWEEDFDPDELSKTELRYYNELWDLVDSIKYALLAIEEQKEEGADSEECEDNLENDE